MQDVAMREYMTEGHEELGMPSSPRKSRRKGRSHGGRTESRAALSSRGATSSPPYLEPATLISPHANIPLLPPHLAPCDWICNCLSACLPQIHTLHALWEVSKHVATRRSCKKPIEKMIE